MHAGKIRTAPASPHRGKEGLTRQWRQPEYLQRTAALVALVVVIGGMTPAGATQPKCSCQHIEALQQDYRNNLKLFSGCPNFPRILVFRALKRHFPTNQLSCNTLTVNKHDVT